MYQQTKSSAESILDICRLCLENPGSLVSIFDEFDRQECLLDKINSCLLIDILSTDKVSKVCNKCIDKVNDFHSFKIQITASQEKLSLLLANYERDTLLAELDNIDYGKDSTLSGHGEHGPSLIDPNSPEALLDSFESALIPEDKLENPLDLRCCNIFRQDPVNPSFLFDSLSKPKDLHTCKDCKKSFTSLRSLIKHLAKCHKKNQNSPNKCSTCNLSFTSKDALKSHILTHREKFFCDKCLYSTFDSSNFNIHMMKHNVEFLFECSDCGKGFYRKQSYEDHKSKEHSFNALRYKCETCNKLFQTKNYLLKHEKIHKFEKTTKKYQCDLCGKVFMSWKGIKRHMTTIHLRHRYTCDVCDKEVTSITSLRDHKRSHAGEKTFTCDECGKSFVRLSSLRVHRRIHTGEKPYMCQTCQKKFSQKSSLNVHMRGHTGEKPYSCPHCTKRFVTRTIMNTHIKTHEPVIL